MRRRTVQALLVFLIALPLPAAADAPGRLTCGPLTVLTTGQSPDQNVRVTKGADEDRQALERHVYPFVEDVAIGAFTVDHADRIMRALPHKEPATRRGYALLVNRICALASTLFMGS